MYFREEKLRKYWKELEKCRYEETIFIEDFLAEEEPEEINVTDTLHPYIPRFKEKRLKTGETWVTRRDRYLWLKTSLRIPRHWLNRDREIIAFFDFPRLYPFGEREFEGLVYLKNEIVQGIDTNHREVILPTRKNSVGKAKNNSDEPVDITIRLWSGLNQNMGKDYPFIFSIDSAFLALINRDADKLYFLGKEILGTIDKLSKEDPNRVKLLNTLDNAARLIDWSNTYIPTNTHHRNPDRDFLSSLTEAYRYLEKQLNEIDYKNPVHISAIGHTHIDVAWLWRYKHTREKAIRSFATVLNLMEKYPEYIFLQSQPQLYEFVKEDNPALYEKIKEKIREGRWEPEGSMWVEADCNLTSGESLVRQILTGKKFFREEFGADNKILWLPDVFGYSWALPQILKKSGIEVFMTTKISWNEYNKFPYDTFFWKGIDGTEILTHFITIPSYGEIPSWHQTYNGILDAPSVFGIWEEYTEKEWNTELLFSYGYGDGGGGVNREMLENRRALEKIKPAPTVSTERASEYFKRLLKRAEEEKLKDPVGMLFEKKGKIATWDGELYLELHRGTYTSQAFVKKNNRKLELLYRNIEILSVIKTLEKGDINYYPKKKINEGWKIILRNQFHDVLPGSSISNVYEDVKGEYEKAYRIAGDVLKSIGLNDKKTKNKSTPVKTISLKVANTANWKRKGLIFLKGFSPSNPPINPDTQITKDGMYIYIDGIEGLSEKKIDVIPDTDNLPDTLSENLNGKTLPFTFTREKNSLETPLYHIKWDNSGRLISIYDKKLKREVIKTGERGNRLILFEDKPINFDAWDINIYYREKPEEISNCTSIELTTMGKLFCDIEFQWEFGNSTIKQKIRTYTHTRRIDFITTVNWHEKQKLLRVYFPTNIRATEATYDIQFGNVKRPTNSNTSWDAAKFEVVGHQWADISEREFGVALLNDSKYGYAVKNGTLSLSLLRSTTSPDPKADIGEHRFTYSLFPHPGDWFHGGVHREAWDLNDPLLLFFIPDTTPTVDNHNRHSEKQLFKIEGNNIHVDAVKQEEDSNSKDDPGKKLFPVILRFHEYSGATSFFRITSDYGIEKWEECNLLEESIGPEVYGRIIEGRIKPYELKTFKIFFSYGG